MGKPESSPPGGQSVEQLLFSIRKAIEADGDLDAAARPEPPALGAAPAAPEVRTAPAEAAPAPAPAQPRISVQTVLRPLAQPKPPAAEPVRDDEPVTERYHSPNPYRFRYSLEGSQTYMALRNRLSSLSTRTRADTDRSMASLLGGDARREEARSRAHYQQPPAEEPPLQLRSSLPAEEVQVEQFASELVSGSVSCSPDYHEWSLDQSLDGYGMEPAPVSLPGTQPDYAEPVAEQAGSVVEEEAPLPEEPQYYEEPEPYGEAIAGEAMIRGIIEPELANWFDEHMPDHVARAMPDEEAFIAMIRPLIEDWLADNLAPIVEQAVKDEIARITGLKR
jgi:cell pole-organizing protein PopZ